MFDRVFDLFRKSNDDTAQQDAREALLDLLVLGMFIDRHIANAEGQFIREQALGFDWQGSRSIDRFVDASMRRARDAIGSDVATDAYLADIASRLANPEAKAKALAACEELMTVDGQLAEKEQALLERARGQFGD